MFENRMLRRIFGYKRDEIRKEWIKQQSEMLNDLYCSPNIFRVTKSRIIRWMGHVACMWERRGVYRVWWGNLRERGHLEDPGIGGKIILR